TSQLPEIVIRVYYDLIDRKYFQSLFRRIAFHFKQQIYLIITDGTVDLHEQEIRVKEVKSFFFEAGINSFPFSLNNIKVERITHFQQSILLCTGDSLADHT